MLTMPIFLGGILAYFVERRAGKPANPADTSACTRTACCTRRGLITGEALMGIVVAFFVWKFKNPDVMALPERFQLGAWEWLGVAVFALIGWLLYRVAVRRRAARVQGRLTPPRITSTLPLLPIRPEASQPVMLTISAPPTAVQKPLI